MAFSRKEFVEKLISTVAVLAVTPIACDQMVKGASRASEIRQGFTGRATPQPIHRLPEPSAAFQPQNKEERLTREARLIRQHLGLHLAESDPQWAETFAGQMEAQGLRVHFIPNPSVQGGRVKRGIELPAYTLPTEDATPLPAYTRKPSELVASEHEVKVINRNDATTTIFTVLIENNQPLFYRTAFQDANGFTVRFVDLHSSSSPLLSK